LSRSNAFRRAMLRTTAHEQLRRTNPAKGYVAGSDPDVLHYLSHKPGESRLAHWPPPLRGQETRHVVMKQSARRTGQARQAARLAFDPRAVP
jgi:hypothetical protein